MGNNKLYGKKKTKIKKKWYQPTWKKFFLLILIIILAAGAAVGSWVYSIIKEAPEIDTSQIYNLLTETTIIYDGDGKKLDTVFSGENRYTVRYKDMPEDLVNAFVALEDKTFWEHHGFNYVRIIGAIKNSLTSGGQVSGTSTITQQLARNVYLKSTMSEHNIERKIIEAWYTIQIERDLSKNQIIEAYLNTINLGFGNYGVEAAAIAYFKTHVNKLTLAQCAALAAIPQMPSEYDLVRLVDADTASQMDKSLILKRTTNGVYVINDASKERRELCLYLMKEQGFITQEAYEEAVNTPLKDILHPKLESSNSTVSYFTDFVIEQVINDLQEEKGMTYEEAWDQVYTGGLRIYTTLDVKTQKLIQDEFKNDSNFPSQTGMVFDNDGNLLNNKGQIAMYDYTDFIKDKKFTFKKDEIKKNKDGSITIKAGKRLRIYDTTVNGQTDYSIEFPTMYRFIDNKLYSVSGGYFHFPQSCKTKDEKGNVIISAEFLNSEQGKEFIHKKKGKYYIKEGYYTVNQNVIQPQAAMTIIENDTGHIKAMVGGRKTSGRMLYNRAVEPRQPGSSIKPLAVYSAALQQSYEEAKKKKKHHFKDYKIDHQGAKGWGDWITAGSTVVDERTTNKGKAWPQNSGGGYSGRLTLRSALRNSINTCAYKIWMQVGESYSVKMVKKYGITTLDTEGDTNDVNAAALALGGMTNGVTTLEMANAYTTFPNNGVRAKKPICYTKVTDNRDKVLLRREREEVRVLDSGIAWIMADLMKGVVSGGTGTAAYVNGVAAGGKTGTTSSEYDIWFDGFTPNLTAALWIGNDVNISLTSMSGYAAALWGKIMNQIPEATKGSYPGKPDNVTQRNGEYYADGTYSSSGWLYWYQIDQAEKARKEKERKEREEKEKAEKEAKEKAKKEKAGASSSTPSTSSTPATTVKPSKPATSAPSKSTKKKKNR